MLRKNTKEKSFLKISMLDTEFNPLSIQSQIFFYVPIVDSKKLP
ncbi:hypothetical protein LEP1GSC017_2830 [Leptospira meyeri serovar Hardjo str. Went 5]|nr:hypothetical protein LEP1GSC017_2830 [Leptospira meyeri serovar Hardjo str. Went 5]